jgi:CDP-diacylglycerol--glycerol-3-phosphate 3-phosphatidyltransferase/cardiolipin synthase
LSGQASANERLGSLLASTLIGLRLIAAPALIYAYLCGATIWALAILMGAVLTDAADGMVGRRWGGRPFMGAYADATADFVLVLTAFVAFVARGVYPFWIVLVIIAMYVQFRLTSRRDTPVYDPVGKYYGVWLFACTGITLLWPHPLARGAVLAGIIIMTAASLLCRAACLYRPHRESPCDMAARRAARRAALAQPPRDPSEARVDMP